MSRDIDKLFKEINERIADWDRTTDELMTKGEYVLASQTHAKSAAYKDVIELIRRWVD